jgi:protein SCO1/2
MTMSLRTWLAALALGAMATPALAHQGPHDAAPARKGYVRTVETYAVPDTKLTDMNGAVEALRDRLAGDEPVMVNFVFTSCTAICPVMTATFAQVQERLDPKRDRLRFVSISIDPEHDTPARLREYAQKFGAGSHWQFLTGSAEASLAVQRAFEVYRGDKMSHDPVTFIRAAADKPWVRLQGFAGAGDLIREYRRIVD